MKIIGGEVAPPPWGPPLSPSPGTAACGVLSSSPPGRLPKGINLPFPHLSAQIPPHPPFQTSFLSGRGGNTAAAALVTGSCVSSPIPSPKRSTGLDTSTETPYLEPREGSQDFCRNFSFLWCVKVLVLLRAWPGPVLKTSVWSRAAHWCSKPSGFRMLCQDWSLPPALLQAAVLGLEMPGLPGWVPEAPRPH